VATTPAGPPGSLAESPTLAPTSTPTPRATPPKPAPTATPPKPTSTPVPPEEGLAGERTPGPQPTPIVPRTGDSLAQRGTRPQVLLGLLGLLVGGCALTLLEVRHRRRLAMRR
jgi:hypothetical protein